MRCIYWQHSFHFIQINEYNTNEDAAGTATAPINIPTRLYYYNGLPAATYSQNYVGNNNLSIYNLELENDTTTSGLQKLAGTVYSGLPAIKKVESIYLGSESSNIYRGFPVLDTSALSGASVDDVLTLSDGGVLTDVADADGIQLQFDLSYKNTTNTSIYVTNMFMLLAHPSSYTTPVGPLTKVCAREVTPNEYVWQAYTTNINTLPFSGTNAVHRWSITSIPVAPNATIDQSVGQWAYSTAWDPKCASNGGLFPVDAAFTGDWTFKILTWTRWAGSGAANPMRNTTAYGGYMNHGACAGSVGSNPLNYDGSALVTYQPITDYAYDYLPTLNPISGTNNPYKGTLKAISTAAEIKTEYVAEVETNNSYILDAGNYFWGEGSTIQVSSDGSTYVDAGIDKWNKPTYAWNNGTSQFDYTVGSFDKSLVELNTYDMIYNQSIALKQFNGTTALSETNKYYSGTTILKYFNPIGRLKDTDGNKYLFMRGGFNLSMDEWNVTSDEMSYNVPSETINIGQRDFTAEISIEDED